jgi:uncharacterized protein YdaU (DUF1376 family)
MQTLLDVTLAETDWLCADAFRALQRLYHHYLTTEEPLVDRDEDLAKIARLPLDTWLTIAADVRQFFRRVAGKLYHSSLGGTVRKAQVRRKRCAAAGRKGGLQRVLNLNTFEASACHPPDDPPPAGNVVMGKFGSKPRNPRDSQEELPLPQATASARARASGFRTPGESAPFSEPESRVERGGAGGERDEPLRLAAPAGAVAPASHATLLKQALELWNQMAERVGRPVPLVQAFHRERARSLAARFKEIRDLMGVAPLEGWRIALEKFADSDWCTGRATGRASTFDQILRPGEFWRLMEGHFDNRPAQGVNDGRRQAAANAHTSSNGFLAVRGEILAGRKTS